MIDSNKLDARDVLGCVEKMSKFLEAALTAAEVPTFGRKEPDRVIRMRKTGALSGKTRKRLQICLPAVTDILSVSTDTREHLREVFYRYAPSGTLSLIKY